MKHRKWNWVLAALFWSAGCAWAQNGEEKTVRVPLKADMIKAESESADFSGLVDEQDAVGNPPAAEAKTGWQINSQHNKKFPFAAVLDLGQERHLAKVAFYDVNNSGDLAFYAGKPGEWRVIAETKTDSYKRWKEVPLSATTRYLRVELKSPAAIFHELVLYAYTDEGFRALNARLDREKREREEREAALAKAKQEVANRPVVEMAPFGKLSLVDEVDVGAADPGHMFEESPKGVSRVETVLGRSCRVLSPTEGEGAFMSFRVGRFKMLKPGAAYVLSVEYPEDESRTWIVQNGGNETSRGFHTGRALGDAFHPKYVNNLNESVNVPLSGKYETWKLFFSLHDRFPQQGMIRGKGGRTLTPDDGFAVTIAQFSARDIPASKGAAVARIRLYEVLEPEKLKANYTPPPAGLPRRHLFWREEMADGVIDGEKEEERGVKDRLDWYRFKARLMHFLGMNTYAKDLLEFGAVQHWDTTPHGGNQWAFFNAGMKDLWGQIVGVMGQEGFGVLPYYEYSGSKGYQGLGNQRRAKPLTRDDAYTHIKWVESSNADITDPDAYEDFKKMLDLTVVRQKDKAEFVGVWLRPRWQLPMSFADATRERFAKEANGGKAVSRDDLKADKALYARYQDWWFGKRRAFLTAMRDYLAQNGIKQPLVLYTAVGSEPGVSFVGWEPRMVTDDPAFWQPILAEPAHAQGDRKITATSLEEVVKKEMYLEALLAPQGTWGGWEWQHANPPSDPQRYKETPGVLMTHAFNRVYTVSSPKTFETFRAPSGLAILRHYTLNENMMFDKADKEKLGYFVADIERTGPYCMWGEALAMAGGDPTEIGYLSGGNFGRGFPEYVRAFNTAFLSLPALPSRVVPSAASDTEIVVREIATQGQGTWYALVNTGLKAKTNVTLKLPGALVDAVTKKPVSGAQTFYPCELKAWWRP